MKKLLVFVALVSLLACHKNKEEEVLPKPLQDLTANYGNCNCTHFIDKYELISDNPPQKDIIYIMSCEGAVCRCTAAFYDANGQPTTLPPGHHIVFVKRVWECKP